MKAIIYEIITFHVPENCIIYSPDQCFKYIIYDSAPSTQNKYNFLIKYNIYNYKNLSLSLMILICCVHTVPVSAVNTISIYKCWKFSVNVRHILCGILLGFENLYILCIYKSLDLKVLKLVLPVTPTLLAFDYYNKTKHSLQFKMIF